jgi:hypothetical protein
MWLNSRGGIGAGVCRLFVARRPIDVQLVMVGGTPMYGDYDLMQQVVPSPNLYQLAICGAQKAVNMEGFSEGWPAILQKLGADWGGME